MNQIKSCCDETCPNYCRCSDLRSELEIDAFKAEIKLLKSKLEAFEDVVRIANDYVGGGNYFRNHNDLVEALEQFNKKSNILRKIGKS